MDAEGDVSSDQCQAVHCYNARHRSTVVHGRDAVVPATPKQQQQQQQQQLEEVIEVIP